MTPEEIKAAQEACEKCKYDNSPTHTEFEEAAGFLPAALSELSALRADRDRLREGNAVLRRLLSDFVEAFDNNGVELKSADISDDRDEIWTWHEEWLSYVRAALAAHAKEGK